MTQHRRALDASESAAATPVMRLKVSPAIAVVVALALSACAPPQLRGGVLEPPRQAPPIELTDHAGRPFSLDAHRGNVVMMFFGYTSCPDVCPTTLATAAKVKRGLGADGDKLRVAFVTVDPQRDTPDKLAKYVGLFDKSFIGLTGTATELRRVTNAYQVRVERRDIPNSDGYSLDHTAFTYVIDKHGNLRELVTFGAPADDILNDMRLLLRE